MKEIITAVFEVIIAGVCLLFCLYVYNRGNFNGGVGIYESVGKLYENLRENTIISDGINRIESSSPDTKPTVRYVGGMQTVGNVINFKTLVEVKLDEFGSYVAGDTETNFSLYLKDIKTASGTSVMECLPTEAIEGMEEIYTAFAYDDDLNQLYIFESGEYIFYIKLYTEEGLEVTYEVNVPVKSS